MPPDGLDTRPTTDRIKESVFNIIQFRVGGAYVLDLFAGSGALGIEAISRGAKMTVLNDKSPVAAELIRSNLRLAKFDDGVKVCQTDALSYLNSCTQQFDIIFLDPPYNLGLVEPVLKEISAKKILKNDGIIVLETEVGGENAENSEFDIIKTAKYGKTLITLLEVHK